MARALQLLGFFLDSGDILANITGDGSPFQFLFLPIC